MVLMESLVSQTGYYHHFYSSTLFTSPDRRQNIIRNGGHFEIQNGGQSKFTTSKTTVLMESLVSQTWIMTPFLLIYSVHNSRYWTKYHSKWLPYWNSKWRLKTQLKKIVPYFFEISTPKLTKLANKIHFGTKIQPDPNIWHMVPY